MFLRAVYLLIIISVYLAPGASVAQTSDPIAVAVLNKSLTASGATNPLNPVRDFVATGTITYFWAGEEVQGAATVKARGYDQFRLDANLPEGTRSYSVSHAVGFLKDQNGSLSEIPEHNTVNTGILSFPYPTVAANLAAPLTAVSYLGLVEVGSRQAHQVRVQRHFSSEADSDGTMSKLCTTDYFVDPQTYLLLKTLDTTHPVHTLTEDLTHEIELQNYTSVNGVMVPTLIREKIIGQTIWEFRLTAISLNTGLTDLDFILQ